MTMAELAQYNYDSWTRVLTNALEMAHTALNERHQVRACGRSIAAAEANVRRLERLLAEHEHKITPMREVA
jgi:hypothetical protein